MTDLRRLAHDFAAGGEQPLFLVAAQSPGVFAALRLVLDGRVFDRVAQSVLSYLDPREHKHSGKTHRLIERRILANWNVLVRGFRPLLPLFVWTTRRDVVRLRGRLRPDVRATTQ